MIAYRKQITNKELVDIIEKDSTTVLDVRDTTDFARSHIPGSVPIPLKQLHERCNELSKDEPIYVICQSGKKSKEACDILEQNDFVQVYHVVSGIDGWTGYLESDLA